MKLHPAFPVAASSYGQSTTARQKEQRMTRTDRAMGCGIDTLHFTQSFTQLIVAASDEPTTIESCFFAS